MPDAPDRAPPPVATGAEYVAQITARASDRRARAAFHDLVLELAPPGATLFDFGAGTGMDARFYAERGFTVLAYDVDPRMCEFFRAHCRELMAEGRVTLESGSYREFLARPGLDGGRGGVALVTANFAPLNLIENLQELFAKFHALTAPDGKLLASVLSPYFLGDLRYGWWWRNLPSLVQAGRFSVPGAQAPIVRRRLADFAAQSTPYFTLQSAYRGLPPVGRRAARGIDVSGGAGGAWLRLTTCRFMFLLFARRSGGATPQ